MIEGADASLSDDRDIKLPANARAGIREVWLVDLEGERLHVFRDPIEGGYRTLAVLEPGDELSLATLPALKVQADAALP